MIKNDKPLEPDSLLLLALGTIATVAVGYLFIGQRSFHISFLDSPFLSIGIGGSLVYVVHKAQGDASALGIAFLLSIVNYGLVQLGFLTVWPHTFAWFVMVVLTCHYLVEWKIEKPVFGRLLLLSVPFAVAAGLITLIFRLFLHPEHMFIAAGNNAIHGLHLGVGLGLGLELGELAIRYLHRRDATPKVA